MNKKRAVAAALSVLLAAVLIITAAAVSNMFKSSSGSYERRTVNRVDIEVSSTQFTFDGDESELYCVLTLKINKTQPDFYGMLHYAKIEGGELGSVVYTAGKNNGEAKLPESVALTTEPLEWEIAFTVIPLEGKTHYDLSLDLNYTTGLKPNTSQRYLTQIPLSIDTE